MTPAPGPDDDYGAALLRRAAARPGQVDFAALDVPALRDMAAREGIDMATALLYHRLGHSPEHGPFICQVDAMPADGPCPLDATLAVVPGAGHIEYPHTGADGRRLCAIIEQLGCRAEVIPVASFGRLEDNGRAVADWLARRPAGPVVLISLSKGGADVKVALAQPGAAEAFRDVVVWVDLCGIPFGTPLVGWLLARWYRRWPIRLLCWYRGYPFALLRDLDRRPGGRLDFDCRPPDHMEVVHLIGFPLVERGGRSSSGLSCRLAERTHRRLAPLGPNDAGGILLGDVGRLPGKIYPVWDADHYLNPSWDVRPLIARLLHWAAGAVEARRRSTCG